MYWYTDCPKCNQGRLILMKNLSSNTFHVHCEECETGYRTPEDVAKNRGFLTLEEEFEAEPVKEPDTVIASWAGQTFRPYI
ncbi:MAG: hypothetical protein HOW73_34905 [Polyangiaceae bacterium]|nr:hypothetical protein [Polyangiaceae bacterium]